MNSATARDNMRFKFCIRNLPFSAISVCGACSANCGGKVPRWPGRGSVSRRGGHPGRCGAAPVALTRRFSPRTLCLPTLLRTGSADIVSPAAGLALPPQGVKECDPHAGLASQALRPAISRSLPKWRVISGSWLPWGICPTGPVALRPRVSTSVQYILCFLCPSRASAVGEYNIL